MWWELEEEQKVMVRCSVDVLVLGYDWRLFWSSYTCGAFWMNQVQMVQCHRKMINKRKVTCDIRSLVNVMDL